MDDLILLAVAAALVILAIPVGVIVLFVRTGSLRDRITTLERRIAELSQRDKTASLSEAALASAEAKNGVPSLSPVAPNAPGIDAAASDNTSEQAVNAAMPLAVEPGSASRSADRDAPSAPLASNIPSAPTRPARTGRLVAWARMNWIYAVSAASLGLAGIFFVQYGVERGLLPPGLRVLAAIAFGLVLIGAGEWIRRRHGDEGPTSTVLLPSVFSGAGLVSIFAATLAARHLYGLITPEVAFAGHLVTAALAIGLGWFYGPLLAAVGLIGAALSPFIVGGGSDAAPWLYAYFALVTGVGLAIDAVRRWAWVSALALVLGYGTAGLSFVAGAGETGWAAVLLVLAIMAVMVPRLHLIPTHPGPYVLQSSFGRAKGVSPIIPTYLAGGAALATTLGLLMLGRGSVDFPILAPTVLAVLALAYLLWADRAEGLSDLALLPSVGFLLVLIQEALDGGQLFRAVQSQAIGLRPAEAGAPYEITLLVGMAVGISAAAALRALHPKSDRLLDLGFGLMAVLVAPLTVAILELLWAPANVIGAYPWALHIIGVAGLATALTTRFAKVDGGNMQRAAHAVLAALSLIALALFVLTTASALTLALAVLLVVAAALDRKFNLPEMGLFQQIATAVITWRLLVDPGLDWALEGLILSVIAVFAGSITALVVAWLLIRGRVRPMTLAVLESAAAGLAAIFANILLTRWLIPQYRAGMDISHWQATLSALPWLVLMLAQLYRAGAADHLRKLRYGVAAVAGVLAGLFLILAIVPLNPLFAYGPTDTAGLVKGRPVLDSLLLAYALPGLMLLAARWQLPQLGSAIRMALLIVGAALVALYAGLEIRRLWQGSWLGAPGVKQGELYTYTLALMALGAGLLYQAIRQRSDLIRRVAMAVIGLTIAKVFFLDAAGLTGLTRVVSFLGLGLSLAGLAWLNCWAGQAAERDVTGTS